jgi:hypothetical protein
MTRTPAFAAAVACTVLGGVAPPAPAAAEPHPLVIAEPYETLIEDKLEVEQRVDAVPVRVAPIGAGSAAWSLRAELATELRHGLTDRLELGVSLALRQDASPERPTLRLAGFAQRARLRLAESGDLPVDAAIQVSLAEHHDGIALAQRLVLSRREGRLAVLANFEVAQQYDSPAHEWKHGYLPAGGVAYELSPRVTVGAEYWARGRFDRSRVAAAAVDDPDDPRDRIYHYAGPALLLQSGRVWLAVGAHVRLDRLTSSAAAGDPFGRLWIRARLGLEL